jgi:hypothetical protein
LQAPLFEVRDIVTGKQKRKENVRNKIRERKSKI